MALTDNRLLTKSGAPAGGVQSIKSAEQTIFVQAGDNLKSVVESISDSSPSKPYAVHANAAAYDGNQSITIPSDVSVIGFGNVSVDATGNPGDCFILSDRSSISNIRVDNLPNTGYSYSMTSSGSCELRDIVIESSKKSIYVNNASACIKISGIIARNPSTTLDEMVTIEAGVCCLNDVLIGNGTTITQGIKCDGANSKLFLEGFKSVLNKNIVTAILLSNSSVNELRGVTIEGDGGATTTAIDLQTATQVNQCDVCVMACDIGMNIQGVGTFINFSYATFLDCNTSNIIQGAGSIARGFIRTQLGNTVPNADSSVAVNLFDEIEGEPLWRQTETGYGTPQFPAEVTFGEGDSYAIGMIVYTKTAAGVFVDVTTEAQSTESSTFTFPENVVGAAIYWASIVQNQTATDTVKHHGLKLDIDTAQVDGEIVLEYWNGVSWVEFNGMATANEPENYPYGKDYFINTGSVQINFDPAVPNNSWSKNDEPSVGTSYYWQRAVIKTIATTLPIFERSKLHSQRFETEIDGWNRYYGNARPFGKIPINAGSLRAFQGAMSADTIWYDENVAVFSEDGQFNSVGDATGIKFELPENTDTSAKLIVRVTMAPLVDGTHDYNISLKRIEPGQTFYETEPVGSGQLETVNVTFSSTSRNLETFEVEFDISNYIGRRNGGFPDQASLSILTNTSLNSVITDLVIEDVKWAIGGHIGV